MQIKIFMLARRINMNKRKSEEADRAKKGPLSRAMV